MEETLIKVYDLYICMDGKQHTKWFVRALVPFFCYLIWQQLWAYLPLAIISSAIADPDEDQKWMKGKTHRNGLTHSAILPLLIAFCFWLPNPLTPFITHFKVLAFPVMIHLFCDLKWEGNEGKARIWLYKRLSPGWSLIWLICNALAILAIILL